MTKEKNRILKDWKQKGMQSSPLRTSGYLPDSSFIDTKLPVCHFDMYLARVYKENHLHASRVFALLDAHWR